MHDEVKLEKKICGSDNLIWLYTITGIWCEHERDIGCETICTKMGEL